MLALASKSLVALACLSAALATPTIPVRPDAAHTRDLAIRQDTITDCQDNYTSKNGLAFNLYCQQNAPLSDAIRETSGAGVWFFTATYTECLEHCSRYRGEGEGCFGATWTVPGSHCWLKTSNVSTAALTPAPEAITALLANPDQMKGYDTNCPNKDLEDKTLPGVTGISYTTHCGKAIAEPPRCFDEFDCLDEPYRGFYHTESLEECLKVCAGLHPLCRAVSWNPGLQVGYANCLPKYGKTPSFVAPTSKQGIIHAAQMIAFDTPDTKCPDEKLYKATASSAQFTITCGKTNPGRNITNLHAQNLTACMDACAASDQGCTAALYSTVLDDGYNNCYLQKTESILSDLGTSIYAAITDGKSVSNSSSGTSGSTASSTSSSSSSSSSSSPSKAWIAGPAIGGVAVLAAIGFAFFWLRRRKAAKAGEKEAYATSPGAGYGYVPGHDGTEHTYIGSPGGGGAANTVEMHAPSPTSELPGSVKYAHHYGPRSEPQELPT